MPALSISEIVDNLKLHDNGSPTANNDGILADVLLAIERNEPGECDFAAIWVNIVQDLESLNTFSKQNSFEKAITRQLLYAINGMISRCIECSIQTRQSNSAVSSLYQGLRGGYRLVGMLY